MTSIPLIEGHVAIAAPAGVPVWDVDPYDAAILAAPEAYYAELRRRGPLVYIPRYAMLACGRYAITKEIFSDHTRFVSSRGLVDRDLHRDAVGTARLRHHELWGRKPHQHESNLRLVHVPRLDLRLEHLRGRRFAVGAHLRHRAALSARHRLRERV